MVSRVLLGLAVLFSLMTPAATAPEKPRAPKKPKWKRERPMRVPKGAKGHADLVYGSSGEVTLHLDVYTPEPTGALPRPMVVWIHGGGWRSGNKANPRATRLVARGYVVASIQYRLSHEAVFPAQIEDCKAAIRWLRTHAKRFGADPDRIGVWGSSAGGHLAALLGTAGDVSELDGMSNTLSASSRVQAVCDCCGPADLTVDVDPEFRRARGRKDSPVHRLLGGSPEEKIGLASLGSPITHVSRDDPPFLVCHGSDDRVVPVEQSRRLHEALKKAGVDSTLHVVEGGAHGIKSRAVDRAVDAFFDRVLGPVPPVAGKFVDPVFTKANFESALLGREASYRVHLPAEHGRGRRRFPLILWLHDRKGRPEDGIDFVRRIDRDARADRMPPVVVVAPSGDRNGWWCDVADGGPPTESVILNELLPHLDATYRIIPGRTARAVEGVGMGGFGALHLAFKRPDLFAAATAIAGEFRTAEEFAKARSREFGRVFGRSAERYDLENPLSLVTKRAADLRGRVTVRLVAGAKTSDQTGHFDMLAALGANGIAHRAMLLEKVGRKSGKVYGRLGERTSAFYREIFGAVVEEEAEAR